MTYIYTRDGSKKIDIDKATLLGDVLKDLNISQQGDNSQLWCSAKGNYFKGSCLNHVKGQGGDVRYYNFIPMTYHEAKAWVLHYYGPGALSRFGFENNAEEL